MAAITVQNLYKIFGNKPKSIIPLLEEGKSKEAILEETGCTVAINNASFQIKEQETFVIMGLSGSGKSTVLRCLNRLIEPTAGSVFIGDENDENILEVSKERLLEIRRRKMSMVFQNFGLFPHRSVIDNVAYGLEIGGLDKQERYDKAGNAIELVGLQGYEKMKPNELSGGMQQRVGLARALANEPQILLMDEAFSALDPLIRADMQDELLQLQESMNKTIVFITHDLDEALKIGDRIAIMKAGMIVQTGTPEQIITEPSDEYVKAFVQNVDRTKIITAGSIMRKPPVVNLKKDGPGVAVRKMEKAGVSTIYVINSNREFQGIVTIDDAIELHREKIKDLDSIIKNEIPATHEDTPIRNLLPMAMAGKYPIAVLDKQGKFAGIITRASIISEVELNKAESNKDESNKDENQEG